MLLCSVELQTQRYIILNEIRLCYRFNCGWHVVYVVVPSWTICKHYYFTYDIGTNSLTISLLFLHYIVKEFFLIPHMRAVCACMYITTKVSNIPYEIILATKFYLRSCKYSHLIIQKKSYPSHSKWQLGTWELRGENLMNAKRRMMTPFRIYFRVGRRTP